MSNYRKTIHKRKVILPGWNISHKKHDLQIATFDKQVLQVKKYQLLRSYSSTLRVKVLSIKNKDHIIKLYVEFRLVEHKRWKSTLDKVVLNVD